jgi:hypothetical protein
MNATVTTGLEPLITRRSWRIIILLLAGLTVILLALWVIRYARNAFAPAGKGRSDTKPDGTPTYIPSSVDQSYIERMTLMVYEVNKGEEYSGFSSKRCEISNNILGMRDEEVAALSIMLQQKYQLRLGAAIGRWKGDGCFSSWLGGEIDKLKNKVKNY